MPETKVKGGDGTLLTAINDYYDLKLPFFGVAGGTVNFLMNDEAEIDDDNHTILYCNLIKVQVTTTSETHTVWAFNDVVIGEFNAWIEFCCTHPDQQIGTFKGAGLVVSTAAGSTGANKNSGGPILPLASTHWAISSIQANRIVNTAIKPREGLTVTTKSRGNVKVAVDGTNHVFTDVTKVTMTQGSSVRVIVNDLNKLQQKRQ